MIEQPRQQRHVLEQELNRLRELVLGMGERVDAAISGATRALAQRDRGAADIVIADDALLNSDQASVRDLAFTVILTQQPVARDLREILSVMHMASELERMGDHCVNVARLAADLAGHPALEAPNDIPALAERCAEQVREMLNAVVARDCERARVVAAQDDRINRIYHRIVDDLLDVMTRDSSTVFAATKHLMAALNYERIGDRVTNLAEDLVFLETGEIEELG